MTRRQKIVIIAVGVLLVLLYTGAAVTGGGSGQGNASKKPGGVVGWLGDLFGQPPTAARADLSSACLSGNTLTVKASCTLTVAKSDKGTRRVKLHAVDAVTVASRAPQGQDTVTDDVEAGKDVSVTVDGNGGDIHLSCADSGATCTLTLG
jgi:hypothetical protein